MIIKCPKCGESTMSKAVMIFSLLLLFILIIVPLGKATGKSISSINYCKNNFDHISNISWEGQKTWMVFHDKPFDNSCCMESGRNSYTRESGTVTYALFGSRGRYTERSCEWITDDYPIYKEPSFFHSMWLLMNYEWSI